MNRINHDEIYEMCKNDYWLEKGYKNVNVNECMKESECMKKISL